MEAHLADFLSYLTSERGLSPHTIAAYGRDLSAFMAYLRTIGRNHYQDVTKKNLVDYLSRLRDAQYAEASISRALAAVKVFFRFLKREGVVPENVSLHLERAKIWQSIPKILSAEEMAKLLAQPDIATAIGARDAAILELLYSSGLRASELCALKIVDVDDDCVKVFGKGSKERLVPLGRPAIAAIDSYLIGHRGAFSHDEPALFVSQKGKPLTRIDIWQIVKKYAAAAEITKSISPHTLRHSFATHLLDNGAELRIIQEMLGHATINSTERYTHVSKTQLQEAFYLHHPRK